ncbi:WD40/YVTN/BNR-like repeat-containing protein [Chryseobacterium echinoideorum]|uniref:WD40/YVTN/BNR-like repeat-containing protein n=1 Tax=Chryseobacterium echinoideorum TaxID=1549648 RepID=UPI0011864C92|nr:glycosyl hydrolase [Chryseobacterium echinoideorum]
MKRLFILTLFIGSNLFFAQQIESFTNIFNDKISIRAIELHDNKIWYSGTDSKFGYVDLKKTQNQKQIRLSEKKLQLRTLAQDKTSFYAVTIESPAYFFKINKKRLTSEIIYTDATKTAFYDALHFVNDDLAFSFSDTDESLKLKLLEIFPKKNSYKPSSFISRNGKLMMNEGEAAFAASNTNLASYKKYLWLGTGGGSARIFKFNLVSQYAEVFETGFIQDSESQGIYSIDFADENFGIAVGGDYTKQEANINNIATTKNGGETWQIQASGNNAGYTTCVKIKPGSKGKEIISVGDQHISYSSDYGKTWKKISDEKGFYVCRWIDKNTIAFAGKDKISIMKLKF